MSKSSICLSKLYGIKKGSMVDRTTVAVHAMTKLHLYVSTCLCKYGTTVCTYSVASTRGSEGEDRIRILEKYGM